MAKVRTVPKTSVVVGLDGSDGSARALRWAKAHLAEVGPILPVSTWSYPFWAVSPPFGGVPAPPPDDFFEERSLALVSAAVEAAGADTLEPFIARGHAGRALVEAATHGSMLVVGSRGRGAITGPLLGSTSAYCASHSTVPVVIVPETADPEAAIESVAVGVDGSPNSDAALAWALEHAPDRASIEAFHSWITPMSMDGLVGPMLDRVEAESKRTLEEAVDRVRSQVGTEREVNLHLRVGDPRTILRNAGADMIVVGSRGHSGIEFLLLGSTAWALTHHPKVAIVIVPCPDSSENSEEETS